MLFRMKYSEYTNEFHRSCNQLNQLRLQTFAIQFKLNYHFIPKAQVFIHHLKWYVLTLSFPKTFANANNRFSLRSWFVLISSWLNSKLLLSVVHGAKLCCQLSVWLTCLLGVRLTSWLWLIAEQKLDLHFINFPDLHT